QALRDELAALTREMEALERQPLEPSNILPTLGDTATQNSPSEVKTRRLLGESTAEVSNTKAKATERSDAELESEKGICDQKVGGFSRYAIRSTLYCSRPA
ncbi:MAG: hypothetical protein AAF544_06685, partial [Bacteroidota bacterium]